MSSAEQNHESGDAAAFYAPLAAGYDDMTDFAARLRLARAFVGCLAQRQSCAAALDVACGTGVYALALAAHGASTVVGTDLAPEMLDQARRHGDELGVRIDWRVAAMQELGSRVDGRFDVILCMGNSLPHLLTRADLERACTGFAARLDAGGLLVVQLLNYERIYAERERIVDVTRRGGVEYVRFYDFHDALLRFNLLEIRWPPGAGEATTLLRGTDLHPYTEPELRQALQDWGWLEVTSHGGLDFSPYDPQRSGSLMLTARRPA